MGKKEFCDFIKYINSNEIQLDQVTSSSARSLINKWRDYKENNGLIYLDNIVDYENVTDFVIKNNTKDMSTIWFDHVVKLTSNKSNLDNQNTELNIRLDMAHYEFKMKFSEKRENLSQHEKEMLKFYRKVAVTALLTGHSAYVEKPLIDKLLLNCRVSPYSGIKCEDIEVRPSEIHGNGVFAINDIPSGTIISFYPVDGYNDDNTSNYKVCNDWIHNDKNVMENHSCIINDNLKIVADPAKISNKSLLGHMINDSVGNTFKGTTTHDLQNGIYEYYMKSNNNCKLKINERYGLIYIVTTKNIEKDSELTFSYSPLYWFSRFDSNIKHFMDVCNDGKIADFIQTHVEN